MILYYYLIAGRLLSSLQSRQHPHPNPRTRGNKPRPDWSAIVKCGNNSLTPHSFTFIVRCSGGVGSLPGHLVGVSGLTGLTCYFCSLWGLWSMYVGGVTGSVVHSIIIIIKRRSRINPIPPTVKDRD